MSWKDEQFIGFPVKDIEEMKRAIELGVNMVEIRVADFHARGLYLYDYREGSFALTAENHELLNKISKLTVEKGIKVQFHVTPCEGGNYLIEESGINVGMDTTEVGGFAQPLAAFNQFLIYERIFSLHGLGSIITVHPPTYFASGRQFAEKADALKNAKLFFELLDRKRKEEISSQVTIGVENMPDPDVRRGKLGCVPEHFKTMLSNTTTIGVTVDIGHRNLADGFSVGEFLRLGIPVVNMHFHGNNRVKDDHFLPNRKNVGGYDHYVTFMRRNRPSVVVEVHINNFSDKVLKKFLARFQEELR